ncbi:hypothetical protein GKR51_04745 [Providencia sp. wls1948]|uniref:hypothetical protein n=1 Tax=Providencia sp. wls1948 TaxID=2675149 RepID=UPI0012B58478|nr:hypothetical protein [Providencia sp. wls1948]MTC07453.1 hypothetical protein [Providencia sp. wls1948]
MKSLSIIFISLFTLNGCAYYSHQFGLGDYSAFCSNIENDRDRHNEKYYISGSQFFYITKNGDYYSEKEFNQLTSPTLINVSYGGLSAKELKDTAKKAFTVKFTNTNTNKNICSSTLVSSDSYEKNYMDSILGRKLLISSEKGKGASGKEIYRDEGKKSLSIQYL